MKIILSRKGFDSREGFTRLKSVGRGQEFVLDCEEYPGALECLVDVLGACTHPHFF